MWDVTVELCSYKGVLSWAVYHGLFGPLVFQVYGVLQKHSHWSAVAKTFIFYLPVSSVSSSDPGISVDKQREV